MSSSGEDTLKVTLNLTQMLIKKLPGIVDGNPVKGALGLAKTVIEIKEAVKDNMGAVERRMVTIGVQLRILEKALDDPRAYDEERNPLMRQLKKTLEDELAKLSLLHQESIVRKIADHENEIKRIAEIFERVNEARIHFELGSGIRIFKAVHAIQEDLRMSLLDRLIASPMADHKYHLVGKAREALGRAACTPGTRVHILGDIIKWANDTSSESPDVYWLFGPAGSGKSTVAYTIARRFELTADVDDTIVLGGNFFCSRQFEETRYETHIVRTLVYHLALKCKTFADALSRSGNFEAVHLNVRTQLEDLLVGPWHKSDSIMSKDLSSRRHYLVVIDALDEIEQQGGSTFLRALLDIINDNPLPGLKFFVTSRPDPDLVMHVGSFASKQTYRLQDVEKEEVQADIAKYLEASLPHFKGHSQMDSLLEFAGGLFICAATLVRHLTCYKPVEQKRLLHKLFSQSPRLSSKATFLLDALYLQILSDAFSDLESDVFSTRLQVLHTVLCTTEPISASIVTKLVCDDSEETDPSFSFTEVADEVLSRLHAVLYTDAEQNILSYHKSFPDFISDQHRSKEYWCDSGAHHRHLTESCFRIMNAVLKFNIANISSSFIFDSEDHELSSRVKQNIPPASNYSSRNWSHHLSVMASYTDPDDPILGTLADFLQLRVIFWIEAMNLLGRRGLCDPMLRAARKWTIKVSACLTERFI
ncbi:hypothetical protein EST38_g4166 [Candolleomyces aberdarensis]|uniref:NACHT domain-containing protein n=1 Tax=Candolleomyces aberdarensis TaxID=2316362 RepID=A0A4Q2DQJ2_9AGAR|nr:hypothetical protein EST38_g4166 [Candolleomyces aberdarensis]